MTADVVVVVLAALTITTLATLAVVALSARWERTNPDQAADLAARHAESEHRQEGDES